MRSLKTAFDSGGNNIIWYTDNLPHIDSTINEKNFTQSDINEVLYNLHE
jgi:hypothetical protein